MQPDDNQLDVNTKPIWDITLKLGEITLVAFNIFFSSYPLACAFVNLVVVGYLLALHNGWGPGWLVGHRDTLDSMTIFPVRLIVA